MFASGLALLIWFTSWVVYACSLQKSPVPVFVTAVCTNIAHPSQIWRVTGLLGTARMPIIVGGAAASFYVLALFALLRIRATLAYDLLRGRVVSYTGRVAIEEEEQLYRGKPNGIVRYYYALKGTAPADKGGRHYIRLEVSQAACSAIDEGGLYIVYYLPWSRTGVGVEPATQRPLPTASTVVPQLDPRHK